MAEPGLHSTTRVSRAGKVKSKVRIGTKHKQHSLLKRSETVTLCMVPFRFLSQKQLPFQALPSLSFSPCMLGGVKHNEGGDYEFRVSEILNPVFFPHDMVF